MEAALLSALQGGFFEEKPLEGEASASMNSENSRVLRGQLPALGGTVELDKRVRLECGLLAHAPGRIGQNSMRDP